MNSIVQIEEIKVIENGFKHFDLFTIISHDKSSLG